MDNKTGGSYTGTGTRPDLNNHGNQCNPNHGQHKGYSGNYGGSGTRSDLNNHSNQSNPNNKSYQGGRSGKK